MSDTPHRRDDYLLIDGKPRSFNRKPRHVRSKAEVLPAPQLSADDAELREQTIRSGDVFVTKGDGTTATRSITGQPRPSGSVRGKRKTKTKPATLRDRELTKLKPPQPAKATTTKGKRRAKSRKRSVDPFATTAKRDRPMTPEQRSELHALGRNPYSNFKVIPTLTRGEFEQLIPKLKAATARRERQDTHQRRQGKKQR